MKSGTTKSRTRKWPTFAVLLTGALAILTSPESRSAGSPFDFLDRHESRAPTWTPELTPDTAEDVSEPAQASLTPFLEEFRADGVVKMYIGYGYEAWFPERAGQLYNMLIDLGAYYGLPLDQWSFNGEQIRFRDWRRGIRYVVRIGTERDEFMGAFESQEVVLYHGHSRYGQGPAFESFSNYFRIGANFPSIEVDTRNRYFRDEPMLLQERFPPRSVNLGGQRFSFQYRGQRDHRSYLPEDSFTKLIPGGDADLKTTRFLPSKQIFYFYSCRNRKYWEESIRGHFPDPTQKLVFGTFRDAFGSTQPDAVMIISLVRGMTRSGDIVSDLNATGDCDNCFTAY